MTPRQGVRLYKIIDECHEAIRRKGAYAKLAVRMPGTWGKRKTRRLCAQGPSGQITMRTYDNKNLIVLFSAAELLTSLEVMRNANFTR